MKKPAAAHENLERWMVSYADFMTLMFAVFVVLYSFAMTKQSEAICVLPGGIGTLDELFEILALRQLHIIDSPLIVVNVNGYFNTLKNMLREMVDYQFVKPHQLDLITFVNDIEDVLPTLEKQLGDIK